MDLRKSPLSPNILAHSITSLRSSSFLAVWKETSLNHSAPGFPALVPRSSCNTAGYTPLCLKQPKTPHHTVELSPGPRARDGRPGVTAQQVEIVKRVRWRTKLEDVRSGCWNGEGSRWEGFLVDSRTRLLLAHRLDFKHPPLSFQQEDKQFPRKQMWRPQKTPRPIWKDANEMPTVKTTGIWSGLQWPTTFA